MREITYRCWRKGDTRRVYSGVWYVRKYVTNWQYQDFNILLPTKNGTGTKSLVCPHCGEELLIYVQERGWWEKQRKSKFRAGLAAAVLPLIILAISAFWWRQILSLWELGLHIPIYISVGVLGASFGFGIHALLEAIFCDVIHLLGEQHKIIKARRW
jgi:hypothetical protein